MSTVQQPVSSPDNYIYRLWIQAIQEGAFNQIPTKHASFHKNSQPHHKKAPLASTSDLKTEA